jgi:hypothetical protein
MTKLADRGVGLAIVSRIASMGELERIMASESVGAGERTIVAVGRDRRTALAILIDQLDLEIAPGRSDDSSRSIVTRAEGTTFEEMAQSLCGTLLDLVESEGSVEGIAFDGMVQTDEGYVGWGHFLLGVGDTLTSALEIRELTATNEAGGVTLTAVLRRKID